MCTRDNKVLSGSAGLLVGWLVGGRLDGWVTCWLVRWLVGRLDGWLVGWLACYSNGWLVWWVVGWLVGLLGRKEIARGIKLIPRSRKSRQKSKRIDYFGPTRTYKA